MNAFSCLLLVAAGCGRLGFDPLATTDAAVAPDAPMSACGNYAIASAPSFTTSSRTFVDVPGSSLELPATGDPWLVFVSAGLRSTSSMLHSIEVRLRADGAVRTTAENQNAQNRPMPWLHTDLLGAARLDVQVRDVDGTGTIDNLQIVAYRVPLSIEAVISEFAAVQTVGTTNTPVVSVSISPSTMASFLVLATGVVSEEPSMSDLNISLRDHTGATWPMPSNGTSAFANSRGTWRSVLWARQVMLSPGAHTFRLEASASSTSGSVRDLKIMILRSDQLGLTVLENVTPTDATTSQPVVMSMLRLPASSSPRDIVTLQLLTVAGGPDATGTNPMLVDFLRDGVNRTRYENYEPTGAPILPYGYADAFTTTAETILSNQFEVADATRVVTGKESTILVLSRTCP